MKKEVYNRLLEEKRELNEKAVKLQCFIERGDFDTLSEANKVELNELQENKL